MALSAQRYPSGLSQGQGGPSRRPARTQYSSPSIDDEVPPPPPPFSHLPPAAPHAPVPTPQLKKSASRPLNPNSKPYTPKNFRSQQNLRSHRTQTQSQTQEPHYPSIPPPEAFQSMYHHQYQYQQQQRAQTPYHPDQEVFSARPQYSSLQHLLEQAGYADTRVATPPAERVGRRIKKTFDEVDADEVRDLYSTFGLSDNRVTHITEPGLPLKSSSSLLRNLALQDSTLINQADSQAASTVTSPQFGSSYDTWWGGGIAALGRAAKAVIEMSPPAKSCETFEEVGRQMSNGVGLGLAKGGEGVRKVKSNWELGCRDQEEIPPIPEFTSNLRQRRSAVVDSILPPLDLPPVGALDEEEFGFSPLPADYEAQCDDDEFFTTSFVVGSIGSTPTDRSRESTVDREVNVAELKEQEISLDSPGGSIKSLGFGLGGYDLSHRIMAEAVDYDDCDQDSPTKKHFVKPLPPVEPTVEEQVDVVDEDLAELSTPAPAPVRKYADRATKLRLARSDPALARAAPNPTWFGSIKSYISPTEASYTSIPTEPIPSSSRPAPMKISPAIPAVPTLAKPVAVVCDSSSDMAEDLPAIPPTITVSPPITGTIASIAVRTKKSLASLRAALIGGPTPPLPSPISAESSASVTPVLSPRLDLAESEYFAGWSPRRETAGSAGQSQVDAWATPKKVEREEDGYGTTEIDYTRSFFYKPCTPPGAAGTSESGYTAIFSDSVSDNAGPVARRQRSIKSLRAALLLPVAPPAPPVPSVPDQYRSSSIIGIRSTSGQSASTTASTTLATPPQQADSRLPEPPVLAILSPGAWEAGLPARELVLEGEEWDARDGMDVGSWSRGRDGFLMKGKPGKGKGKIKRKGSKKSVRAE